MKKENFVVTGMTCSACSSRVEKAVRKLSGTDNVSVNLLTGSMSLSYDEGKISPTEIIKAVTDAGYGAYVKGKETQKNSEGHEESETNGMKKRLCLSFLFLVPLVIIAMHHHISLLGIPLPDFFRVYFHGGENAVTFAFSQLLLVMPIVYLNRRFFESGIKSLLAGSPNMDSLVALGSGAALFYGIASIFMIGQALGAGDMELAAEYGGNLYFESCGMILTLITLGKYFEAKAKGETKKALEKLVSLAPKTARVVREGSVRTLPVAELLPGDEILVRPGESIPADGIVLEGNTGVDESALTGESLPVIKGPGSRVISATLNKSGAIRFRADKVGSESTINQIIRLVEDATASKAPIAKLADKIAGVFVPSVLAVAFLAGCFWLMEGASEEFVFSIIISVLVISCPCALGLATPVAIMVGTGRGAETGILFKSGEALEAGANIDTVVLDKTGTITEGHPRVVAVFPLGMEEKFFLQIAAGLEENSEHPLAEAVLKIAEEKGVAPAKVKNFRADFGRGVTGEIDGAEVIGGNIEYLAETGVDVAPAEDEIEKMQNMGATPLLFAKGNKLIGILAAADTPKPTSKAAISRMRAMGLDVVMLTGDNERTARVIGEKMGLTQVIAGVLPAHKDAEVKKLQAQGKKVAMIGDGINDAPALARADIGIAIGAGTDVAIESADAVLMKNDLLDGVSALKLAKAVIQNIKENLFWAFFYNVIAIPLAAGVFYPSFGLKLSPMVGAAAMSMSSVTVVLNALRLRGFKPEKIEGLPQNDFLTQDVKHEEEKTMQKELHIEGMMCAHCQKHVHDALSKMDGVTEVKVDLEGKKALVTMDKEISRDDFAKVITEAGYELTA